MRMRNAATELILQLWRFTLESRRLTFEPFKLTLSRGGLKARPAYLHHCDEDPDTKKTLRINMIRHSGIFMNSYKFLPKNHPPQRREQPSNDHTMPQIPFAGKLLNVNFALSSTRYIFFALESSSVTIRTSPATVLLLHLLNIILILLLFFFPHINNMSLGEADCTGVHRQEQIGQLSGAALRRADLQSALFCFKVRGGHSLRKALRKGNRFGTGRFIRVFLLTVGHVERAGERLGRR
jgi:hypothetical protein